MKTKVLNITLPTGWSDVTRWQAIVIGQYFWKMPLTDAQLGRMLVELSGLNKLQHYRKGQLFKNYVDEEQLTLILDAVDGFTWTFTDLCYERPKLGYVKLGRHRYHGPSAALRSMSYEQYMDYADKLANEYVLNRNPQVLANLMATLYLPAGKPFRDNEEAEARGHQFLLHLPQAEQHAALNDFLAMRRWLFTRPEYAVLASFDEQPSSDRNALVFSDAVFSWAGEDLTKMKKIRRMPLHTVLDGMAANQRKAAVLRGKGGVG